MAPRQIDAVIFDFGGVLVHNGTPRDFASRFPGHDPAKLAELFMGPYGEDTDHPWHRVERGELALAEAMRLTRAAAEEQGIPVPPPREDPPAAFSFEVNEEMVELVRDLRVAGHKTALVTNNAREIGPMWRPLLPLEELFDVVIDSSEEGIRKPNPAIYRLALERLGGAAPERTVFVDDIETNVAAARALGMVGVVVDDPSRAIAEVRRLAGL